MVPSLAAVWTCCRRRVPRWWVCPTCRSCARSPGSCCPRSTASWPLAPSAPRTSARGWGPPASSSFTCFVDTVRVLLPALWIRYMCFYLLCGYGMCTFTCFVDTVCALLPCFVDTVCALLPALWIRYVCLYLLLHTVHALLPALWIRYMCFCLLCGYGTCAFICCVGTIRVFVFFYLLCGYGIYIHFYLLCRYGTCLCPLLPALWIRYVYIYLALLIRYVHFSLLLWIRYVYFYLICGYGTCTFTCFVDTVRVSAL